MNDVPPLQGCCTALLGSSVLAFCSMRFASVPNRADGTPPSYADLKLWRTGAAHRAGYAGAMLTANELKQG